MSVLIKGIKMPQNCAHCELFHDEGFCIVTGKSINHWGESRNADCPLVELPDHGDLIDREVALYKANRAITIQDAIDAILDAPTVIPAERSNNGET